MENKCKDCGCDKPIPVAPCSDPAICPQPEVCNEKFDTDCIYYNGQDISCNNVREFLQGRSSSWN